MGTNHVDGEILIPGATRTDLDIRMAALNAAIRLGQGKGSRDWALDVAKSFENYLRNGAAS
jgi:hypothetical protein